MTDTGTSPDLEDDPSERRVVGASLDEASIPGAVEHPAGIDPSLGRLIERNGNPPLRRREPGFRPMVHLITGQQVSLESAAAATARPDRADASTDPAAFPEVADDELCRTGFSRQKLGYVLGAAVGILDHRIDFDAAPGAARWMRYRVAATRVVRCQHLGGDDGDRFAGVGR